jgi:hypothetical protein
VRWFFEGPLAATAPAMDGPFTVEVSYAGGEIRDVKATLVEACTDDGPCPCESRVEADFTVRLWSADGMLDETWTITIGHEPQAGGFGRGTYFQHTFSPDTPRGLLSPQTVHQGENVSLLEFVLDARFDQGAVRGSLIANAFAGENMEGFVGASLNDFSGVVAVNAAACETFTDAEGCAGVGCTPVMGEPVHTRADGCFCNPAFVYCLAAPLEGTPEPTMYTRFADGRYSSLDEPHDEVVIFDVRSDTAPGGWRLCTDAPEVAACGCFDDPPTCEPD